MAPSKKKGEKMAIGDFLNNQSLGSWADEMDSQPIPSVPSYSSREGPGGERRAFTQPSWERSDRSAPSMDRGASYDRPRFSDREPVAFPTKPPYTAHLGNLDYNVTSVDIEDFLSGCEVTTVRIMEDKLDRKPKGFGYVEFGSPEGLRKALDRTESSFMGRNIKISVADPPKNDRPEISRDFSDWTRRGPLPDLPSAGRQPSNRGFNRNADAASDAGSERGGPGGNRRPGFFENDSKVRDFSNWERKGPLSPPANAGPPASRDGARPPREGAPPFERRASPAWGEGRPEGAVRPGFKEYEPREPRPQPERAPTAAEQDNQWRARMKPDAAPTPPPAAADTPTASAAPSGPTSPVQDAPKERPRLNLAKRTVSTAEPDSASASATDAKASPFGAARPIDTASRERELEEKREIALRQKKEADDKAKEERTARDAAAKAARAEKGEDGERLTSPSTEGPRRGSRQASRQNGPRGPPKENGDGSAQPTRASNFSILQRGEEGGEDVDRLASANGNIVDDKETKPQEATVAADAAAPADTAQTMEEDGWSTVPASGKVKNSNNRRAGGRAIAS